jgi:hypothetical protein
MSIFLREWPVWSITSLKLDVNGWFGSVTGSFASTTALTSGVDYVMPVDPTTGRSETGQLLRINGLWPLSWARPVGMLSYFNTAMPGCIKAVYVGGFDPIPYDLQLAVWQICAERRLRAVSGQPKQSESDEGYSYSLGGMSDAEMLMIGSVRQLLTPYIPIGSVIR